MQGGIRALKPPIGDGVLALGEDPTGLAAVALVYWAGRQSDVYVVKLTAVAVALRCRRKALHYGDEALEVAMEAAADQGWSLGLDVLAVGVVHPLNRASRSACQRAGMRLTEVDGPHVGYEEWAKELPLPHELRNDDGVTD